MAREMAANAEESGGRTMIIMGAGICQWFHGDATYRAMLALLMLTGSMGRNGGGWAHYVGPGEVPPGHRLGARMAMATDWSAAAAADDRHGVLVPAHRPVALRRLPRRRARLAAGRGHARRACTPLDTLAQSARLGWMPSYPQFDRNPLDLADEAIAADADDAGDARRRRSSRTAGCASPIDDPDAPQNWPRVLTLWRANLLGSSAKGDEYFLRHLLGTHANLHAPSRPRPTAARATSPGATTSRREGKLDLLLSLDFRMTSSTLLSDVVLPAATWYEKHDLSTPPTCTRSCTPSTPRSTRRGEARTDFDTFHAIARRVLRAGRAPTSACAATSSPCRCSTTPRARPAQPGGVVLDWRAGEVRAGARAGRCRTSSSSSATTRRSRDKMAALGPLVERLGLTTKAVTFHPDEEVAYLAREERGDARRRRPTAGRRSTPTPRWPRRSSRCPAPRTAGSPCRASGSWSGAPARRSPTSPRAARRSGSLRRHPGPARSR